MIHARLQNKRIGFSFLTDNLMSHEEVTFLKPDSYACFNRNFIPTFFFSPSLKPLIYWCNSFPSIIILFRINFVFQRNVSNVIITFISFLHSSYFLKSQFNYNLNWKLKWRRRKKKTFSFCFIFSWWIIRNVHCVSDPSRRWKLHTFCCCR